MRSVAVKIYFLRQYTGEYNGMTATFCNRVSESINGDMQYSKHASTHLTLSLPSNVPQQLNCNIR
jgi:hypothetical protein